MKRRGMSRRRGSRLSLKSKMGRIALQMQNRDVIQARRVESFWRDAGSARTGSTTTFGNVSPAGTALSDVRYVETQLFTESTRVVGCALFANSTFGTWSGIGSGGNKIFVGNHWARMTFTNRYQEGSANLQQAYPMYIRAMIVKVSDDAIGEESNRGGLVQGILGQVSQIDQYIGPQKIRRQYQNKDICGLRWKLNPSIGTVVKSKTFRLNSGESKTISLRHMIDRTYLRIDETGTSGSDKATTERTYALLVHVHGAYANSSLDLSAEAYTSMWNLGEAQTFTAIEDQVVPDIAV